MKTILRILFLTLLIITACETQKFDYSADTDSGTGTAGSLARFAISGNYLYTVEISTLKIFDITNESKPTITGEFYVGWGIETIYPMGNILFLGARSAVHIIDISNPVSPQQVSTYYHIKSCDPVVAKGNYAYATLNSTGPCSQGLNQLDVIDISNLYYPSRVNSISMESPRGLGIKGSLLFVCDQGLKIFDISDPADPVFLKKLEIDAYDVIPIDTLLLVATDQGLAQYSIDNDNNLQFLSTIYSHQ